VVAEQQVKVRAEPTHRRRGSPLDVPSALRCSGHPRSRASAGGRHAGHGRVGGLTDAHAPRATFCATKQEEAPPGSIGWGLLPCVSAEWTNAALSG
jgi:hypothetical protein